MIRRLHVFSHQSREAQFVQLVLLVRVEFAHVSRHRIASQLDWANGRSAQVEQEQARVGAEATDLVMPALADCNVHAREPASIGDKRRHELACGTRGGWETFGGEPLALLLDEGAARVTVSKK